MKFFIGIFLFMTVISCSSNDDNDNDNDNNTVESVRINGNWKPYKYEFRGKSITLNDCDKKGEISINSDFSGTYERYELSPLGVCNHIDSYGGKWSYDNSSLTITYNEAGTAKTLKKTVQSFTDVELRVLDNSKDLDDTPGNDQATLVFVKQ
ncbi:lipocalin family protein [Chryseobacterium carnipullorum]|uniref:lipocalin family protein n=1 Tax=Chryseobacterium carnipullorum TaxID=1124835 RepID=UPI000E8E0259|nr:lipocalin family protein [Chryseobacterium carnipullorum]HBV15079.1 hypothetical protein [Chryseobacterium carnipullorum]